MGNNKFKLSDMIPNAWFYKLKDMTKTKTKTKTKNNTTKKTKALLTPTITTKTHPKPQPKLPPKPDPPRRSANRRSTYSSRRRKPVFKPRSRFASSSSTETSSSSESLFPSDLDLDDPSIILGLSSDCTCRLSSSTADIIIDLDTTTATATAKQAKHKPKPPFSDDVVSELDLPPILTKPINFDDTVFRATRPKTTPRRSPGVRLRAAAGSPRLARARRSASSSSASYGKRYLAESLAVVKSSVDPQSDFRESMVEMIVENNIRASTDLEELLACYLSLNSKEYHDVIVKAFQQIWFHMADNIRFM